VECYVEKWLIEKLKETSDCDKYEDLNLFDAKNEQMKERMHYAVTLGGDGTILYAAKQFTGEYIPPIVSFSLVSLITIDNTQGSLGYMCNFEFEEY
jgi:NAD kinase